MGVTGVAGGRVAADRCTTAVRGGSAAWQAVERYVRQFLTADGRTRAGRNPRPAPAAPLTPKTRQVTRWRSSATWTRACCRPTAGPTTPRPASDSNGEPTVRAAFPRLTPRPGSRCNGRRSPGRISGHRLLGLPCRLTAFQQGLRVGWPIWMAPAPVTPGGPAVRASSEHLVYVSPRAGAFSGTSGEAVEGYPEHPVALLG